MIIANGREAVDKMLQAFSRQRGYRLTWDFDPAKQKTEYRFRKDIGHTELVNHIYVLWFEADDIWTVLNTIIDEVDMNFYKQEHEEFLKAGECAAQGVAVWPKVNPYLPSQRLPEIKKVIFNAPATIVLWADGTKTVVKATNEEYDPEKGLAMAISKKALGNKREYYHTFLHWLKKYDDWKVLEDKATREFRELITSATGFVVSE